MRPGVWLRAGVRPGVEHVVTVVTHLTGDIVSLTRGSACYPTNVVGVPGDSCDGRQDGRPNATGHADLPAGGQADEHRPHPLFVTAATGIGLFLPPIGVGLFISCGIAGITVDKVTREMMPYVTMLTLGLLLVIAFPWLTLVLPRAFGM